MPINLQKSPKNKPMRKFNQSISVEIEVDSIANQLLSTINADFPHRESVVEAIIGTALVNDRDAISQIYNALNGYQPEIPYEVGDILNCKSTTYMYVTEQSRDRKDSQRAELGKVKVLQINPYSKSPLLVEYDYYNVDGKIIKDTNWVKLKDCTPFENVAIQEDIFN